MTTHFAANDAARLDAGQGRGVSGQLAQKVEREGQGEYRLPHDVADRLKTALAGYRNREAAHALAVFLARFWSSRTRLAKPFPVDRRALADRGDLGLTEARIRGALRVLEEIGFLNRGLPAPGSVHKLTPAGELHRKPVLYGFGAEFGPLFAQANARAERARLRREGRAVHGRDPVAAWRPRQRPCSISPKDMTRRGSVVIMGEVAKGSSTEPRLRPDGTPSPLEAALRRLLDAGGIGGGSPAAGA